MVTSSSVTRMASTPGAVGTTVTVWVATVSPFMVATMVALPRATPVISAVGPVPLTSATLLSWLVQVTWVLSARAALSLPTRVASAVSPATMLLVAIWME